MSFINIGRQTIHTSSLPTLNTSNSGNLISVTASTSTWTTTTANWSVYTNSKYTYHVLGKDIEVNNDNGDTMLINIISTLNVLGKPYYDELKKNGYTFPKEIESYLKTELKIIERDKKLKDILDK